MKKVLRVGKDVKARRARVKELMRLKIGESEGSKQGQGIDKVDYWRTSNQKQRWLATALLDIEPRLNRIRGYMYLPVAKSSLK